MQLTDWAINVYAKAQGLTAWLMDLLPMIGALGGILGIIGGILTRAAAAHDPAGVFHAVHPTPEELAGLSLSFAVLKSHFNHVSNAAKIEDHGEKLATVVPTSNSKP